MSNELLIIEQGGFPPLQPYRQDPEPEPTLEQKHAARAADGLDDRLFLTMSFVRYEEDGAICGCGDMAYGLIMSERLQKSGILLGFGMPDTHYVDREKLAVFEKLPNPTTLNGNTLDNLPVPCKISIRVDPETTVLVNRPTVYEIEDSSVILEFDYPAVWEIKVLSVKHLTKIFKVTKNG